MKEEISKPIKELIYVDNCTNGLQTFKGRLFSEQIVDGDHLPEDLEEPFLCAARLNHFVVNNLVRRVSFQQVLEATKQFYCPEDELTGMLATVGYFDEHKTLELKRGEGDWDLEEVQKAIRAGGMAMVGTMEAGLDGHVGDMGEHWSGIIGEGEEMAVACSSWRRLQAWETVGFYTLGWKDLQNVGWWSQEGVVVEESKNQVRAMGGWERGPMGLVIPRKR